MSVSSLLEEPGRVDEPRAAQEYAEVLTRVVAAGRPIIVRRDGRDLAAVVPLEQWEALRDQLARQEAEKRAATIDWTGSEKHRPPQTWFDDDADNPVEPDEIDGPSVPRPIRRESGPIAVRG